MKAGMVHLDRYTFQARLLPALIVVFPIALTTVALGGASMRTAGLSIVTWAGGTMLLAQLARDGGKRREPALFESWGGKPTVARLRHRGPTNPIILARWHSKLKKEMGAKFKVPTPAEENGDPRRADDVYEACGHLLRTHTRDEQKFPLVFAENINYGYRRNLWGMKPIGISIVLMSIVIMVAQLALDASARSGIAVAAVAVDLLLLVCWLFVITAAWVRVPAEAYAERLLEACDTLP